MTHSEDGEYAVIVNLTPKQIQDLARSGARFILLDLTAISTIDNVTAHVSTTTGFEPCERSEVYIG